MHRAVAAEREHVLGPDHPDTLAATRGLGFTEPHRTRRRSAARVRAGRPGQGSGHSAPTCHPDTLAARQEMAYVLGQLGRHFEAHQAYTAVLAVRERAMGPDHPDTLRRRHNLAFNLSRPGPPGGLVPDGDEVAAARARVLGATTPTRS